MVDFTHYIKAKSVVDTYMDNIRYLNGVTQKQHFLTRLSLCDGYKDILDNTRKKQTLFAYTRQALDTKLKQTSKEVFDDCVSNDSNGYMDEIKKVENGDIDFYFDMNGVIEDTCILLRNGMEIPDVSSKINKRNILKLIELANNDTVLKKLEGTTYVNGIGGLICLKKLKKELVVVGWDTIYECFEKIWNYYLDEVWNLVELNKVSSRIIHDNVYGLTHCVINLTNFYTEFIGNNERFIKQIKRTVTVLERLLCVAKADGYKRLNNDTLAEVLLTMKLCGGEYNSERMLALDALSLRFNAEKLMFDEHKYEKMGDELIKNEHTNILYVLNVLF